jgi:hypothetical protein
MKRFLAAFGVALLVAGGYAFFRADPPPAPRGPANALAPEPAAHSAVIIPHPTTPRKMSLDPEMFDNPQVHAAYQVAKKKPQLLEKMSCYCGCMNSVENHTSNYECFVDNHGVGCALCRRIALEADELDSKGMPASEIKKTIDARYAR